MMAEIGEAFLEAGSSSAIKQRRRIRLRTMLWVVAGFALVFFAGSMVLRHQHFLKIAEWHASQETSLDVDRFWFARTGGRVRTLGENSVASYHAGLKQKYEQAAKHPWLIVEPDPPFPGR